MDYEALIESDGDRESESRRVINIQCETVPCGRELSSGVCD